MILAVDNGSSYTSTLFEHIKRAQVSCEYKTFDDPCDITTYSGYILSGRRRNDRSMNVTNSSIIHHAMKHDKPLLGICYGAEMLALVSGGTIRRMPSRVKGLVQINTIQENPLCSGDVEVYESHAYEISRMPPSLIQLAGSLSCRNEVIRYGHMRIFGTQFHPEMTSGGRDMLDRFLELTLPIRSA